MKLIRCDYCGKDCLSFDKDVYTVSYPLQIFGSWECDKHFCSAYCVSEYFYDLSKKLKEGKY